MRHLLSLAVFSIFSFFAVTADGETASEPAVALPLESGSTASPPRLFGPNKKISAGREWTPEKNPYWRQQFFTHTFSSGSHSIAVYEDNIYVVWYDTRRGSADIYFSRSTDGGETFTPSMRVNDDELRAIHYKPSLGVDAEGHIYAVWRDDRNGHADIYFAKSMDGGMSFSKNARLNDDRGRSYQGEPALAVGPNGLVGVVWNDDRNKNSDIYLTLSYDGGITFSKNRKVNDDEGKASQSYPAMAIGSDGLIVIAWQDFRKGDSDIYIIRSEDGGKTFSPNQKLSDDEGTAPQVSPSVVISGETVLVAWADYRNGDRVLSPPDPSKAEPAWWEQVRKGNADIYYTVSRDKGVSFTPNAKINDDDGMNPQVFPSVAVDAQGRLFAAWEDYRSENADIFFAQSLPDGIHFDANLRVNDDARTAGQYHPSLATHSDGRAYLIWTDVRDGYHFSDLTGENDEEIFFKKKKGFRDTPQEVYFAIGETDKPRLFQYPSP